METLVFLLLFWGYIVYLVYTVEQFEDRVFPTILIGEILYISGLTFLYFN
jgi:hypothetical protein